MPPIARYLLTFTLVIPGFACKKLFKPGQPRDYDSPAMHFTYPGNWKIDGRTDNDGVEQVTLQTGNSQLVIITVFKQKTGTTLEEFAQMTSDERAKNVDDLLSVRGVKLAEQKNGEFNDVSVSVGKKKYKGISEKFNIRLLGIDVPHIAAYFALNQAEREIVYIIQSPEKEWEALKRDFSAIAATLKTRAW